MESLFQKRSHNDHILSSFKNIVVLLKQNFFCVQSTCMSGEIKILSRMFTFYLFLYVFKNFSLRSENYRKTRIETTKKICLN